MGEQISLENLGRSRKRSIAAVRTAIESLPDDLSSGEYAALEALLRKHNPNKPPAAPDNED